MKQAFGHRYARCLVLLAAFGVVACRSGSPGDASREARFKPSAGLVPSQSRDRNGDGAAAALDPSAAAFLDGRVNRIPEFHGPVSRLAWFAAMLDVAMRESRDVGPRVALGAQEIVMSGGEGDVCRAVAEVDHRTCCMRAGFVAAALEGLVAGISAHPESLGLCRDAETLARLEAMVSAAAPEIRPAAARLRALLVGLSEEAGVGR